MNDKKYKIVFGVLALLLVVGFGNASKVSDSLTGFVNGVFSGSVNASNINADGFNTVRYVIPDDGADLKTKVELGGHIIIPCGTYTLTSDITLVDNTFIEGSGYCTVIHPNNNVNFVGSNTEKVIIKDLYVDYRGLASGRVFDFFGGVDYFEMSGVYVKNVTDRVITVNGSYIDIHSNNFEEVADGIGVARNTNELFEVKIYDNTIVTSYNSSSPTEYGEGIEVNAHEGGVTCLISNNYIEGFRENGIDVNCAKAIVTSNFVNMVSDESRNSIGIIVNSETRVSGVVSNNYVYNVSDGNDGILIGDNAVGISVVNNKITGASGVGTGIRWQGAGTNNLVIDGNVLSDLSVGLDSDIGGNSFYNIGINYFNGVTTKYTSPDAGRSVTWLTGTIANFDGRFNFISTENDDDYTLLVQSVSVGATNYTGVAFKVSGDYNSSLYNKGAVLYERTGSNGVGNLHLSVNSGADTSNADLSDSKFQVKRYGQGHFEPIATAPASDLQLGDVYVDTSGAYCFYNSTAWEKIGGSGTCV